MRPNGEIGLWNLTDKLKFKGGFGVLDIPPGWRLSVTYAFVIKSLDWNLSVSLGFLPPSAGWLSKPSPVGEGVGEADG